MNIEQEAVKRRKGAPRKIPYHSDDLRIRVHLMPPKHEKGGYTYEFTVPHALNMFLKSQWNYLEMGQKVTAALVKVFGPTIKFGINYGDKNVSGRRQ